MVQYSDAILGLIGGPGLSGLTTCGAKELPEETDYLDAVIWAVIFGATHPDKAVLHLDITLLRHTNSAVNSYVAGQKHLHHYIEGLVGKQHGLRSYLSASSAFENCVGSIWKAAEVFDRMKRHVMSEPGTSLTVFTSGSNTDLERVNKINNTVKHFKPEQAEKSSAPIWITDRGLESLDASLDFEELYDNLIALRQVCRTIFVEIPTEARDLKEKQSKGSIPT